MYAPITNAKPAFLYVCACGYRFNFQKVISVFFFREGETLKHYLFSVKNIQCRLIPVLQSPGLLIPEHSSYCHMGKQSGACWEERCSGGVKRHFEPRGCLREELRATIEILTAGASSKPEENMEERKGEGRRSF